MKKATKNTRPLELRSVSRLVLLVLGLFTALMVLRHSANAQNNDPLIDIHLVDVSLQEALEALREKAQIDLIYNHELIKDVPKVSLDIQQASVGQVLNILLKDSGLSYKVINNTFVITRTETEAGESPVNPGLKQTLRGQIIDQESKVALPYATVQVMGTNPLRGATSDMDGNFKIANLALGRYTLKISYVGYEEAYLPEVVLGSGKETVLTIPLVESLTSLEDVIVTAHDEVLNEMAIVSGKSFNAEETKRYAASLSDPARMAQVLAGVAATDDVSNEIVIRGNSPNWLLWKMEGVEIPSPNHFAEEGYTSGAISILSSNMLGSSDFYTGAFSADYGNAISGVFDLRLRNGNNQSYEHTFQAGVLGIDVASEGPFKKGYEGSYLFNYRYSTLSLLNNLNIEVSENALPNYQDLSFKINLPTAKAGTFSIWGIGGLSDAVEKWLPDSTHADFYDGYSDLTKSGMYATGITHTIFVDDQSYFETVISSSASRSSNNVDEVDSLGILRDDFNDRLNKQTFRISSFYNRKFNSRLSMRYGVIFSDLNYDYFSREADDETQIPSTDMDSQGRTQMYQGYGMAKYKLSEDWVATAGVHYTYFDLNQTQAIEPRLGLAYDWGPTQKFTFGYGMHSRHQNLPVYFLEKEDGLGNTQLVNKDLKLTQAHHFVLGYTKNFDHQFQFKAEAYYQHIEKVPVPNNPDKYYSPIFGGFDAEDTLVSKGKGRNYGLELTLQKSFSNHYYLLITSSLFDSKYKPLDGQWHDTRYNIHYVNNVVGGKEWVLRKDRLLSLNAKVVWTGGKRQYPIDLDESRLDGETVFDMQSPWSEQTQDYFRIDMGIKMHFFKKNKEHVLSLDIQNVTNRYNTWAEIYDSEQDQVIDYPMAGIIPILNYRLEF